MSAENLIIIFVGQASEYLESNRHIYSYNKAVMIIRTSYVLLSAAATVFGARFSPIAAIADMDADRVQVAGILRGAHSNGLDVYNDYYLGVILDEFVGKLKIRRSYCMHRHAGWKPAQEDMVCRRRKKKSYKGPTSAKD